jgi:pimeloyl-ACP methyl ester carboxylesterase
MVTAMDTVEFTRTDSDFMSLGTRCSGWLYVPAGKQKPPVVVMAHGFGAEKTFGLPWYAERFAQNGLAVYVFDYRNFGHSDGQPRNLVDPQRHNEDWRNALTHVRRLPQVDPQRIGLWGTSFSGGHVIVTAARDQNIKAIVSQVPFVDGMASLAGYRPGFVLKALVFGFRDLIRSFSSGPPYMVPVVGRPDEFAVMNGEDAWAGYMALVPKDAQITNQVPARILLKVGTYRPIKYAPRVNCPCLMMVADKDRYIPVKAVLRTAERLPQVEVVQRPVGHFDIYQGEEFETAVQRQTEFFLEHLEGGAHAA